MKRHLAILVLFGLLVRALFFVWSRHSDELFLWPVADEATYLADAAPIAHAPLSMPSYDLPFWQPPGYVFLLAILSSVGMKGTAVIVLQQLVGVISAVLVYFVATTYFGSRARTWALVGGLLFSCCPAVLYFETHYLKPTWSIVLVLGILLLYGRCCGPLGALFAGCLTGILCLFEAYYLLFLPPFLVLYFRRHPKHALAYLCSAMVFITPVTVLNTRYAKRFIPISDNGGINLYVGNNPRWEQTYNILPGWEWTAMANRHAVNRKTATGFREAASTRFMNDVLAFGFCHPWSLTRILLKKSLIVFSGPDLIRDDYFFFSEALNRYSTVFNAALIVLAGISVPKLAKLRSPLLIPLVVILPVNVLFFPTTRYRVPALAVACCSLAACCGHRPSRADVLCGFLGLLLCIAGSALARGVVDQRAWKAFRYAQIANKLVVQGDTTSAGPFFERSLQEKPTILALRMYGEYLLDYQSNAYKAVSLFRQAIELDPLYPDPYYDLARIAMRDGKNDDAYASFRSYVRQRDKNAYSDSVDPYLLLQALVFISAHEQATGRSDLHAQTAARAVRLARSVAIDPRKLNPRVRDFLHNAEARISTAGKEQP